MKSKRFIITCFSLFLTLSVLAISKDSLHAVTMVSYEQRSTDDEGTLALRNNTGEDIKDVSFRIEYLDMAGKPPRLQGLHEEDKHCAGNDKESEYSGV